MKNIALIEIEHDAEAKFVERPNRFLGVVNIIKPNPAENVKVHVRDPGRLVDILLPGRLMLLKYAGSVTRKTKWDLIAGFCNDHWVLVNSGYHRSITERILTHPGISPFGKIKSITPEVTFGHSRLDFVVMLPDDSKIWIEVKGCTLAENGIASFPDAPTTRGRKHLESLIELRNRGERASVIFLVFRNDAEKFAPNEVIDPLFARAFEKAVAAGVEIYSLQFGFDTRTIRYLRTLPVVMKSR
ncbi:DNA/RNA nuclease SfsA [candidate division KSB1 bacterium]|nr:DNA/RNA nuclease SfsA [candidate division KSB1 bacterium]